MKHVPIKLGPLALLLAVVAICLTILSILSFTTGQADLRLAQRYADTVKERYALEAEGQQFFADVCEGKAPEAGQAEISGSLGSLAQETGQLRLDYTLKKNALTISPPGDSSGIGKKTRSWTTSGQENSVYD